MNFGSSSATVELKGSTDCSGNPNYPAANQGDRYYVSVAGKIGGASGIVVEAGDSYEALADNTGGTQAAVGTSWAVYQGNVVAASATVSGIVELATDAETVTGTDTARATTPANITAKMAAPGAIGGTTPAAGTFTTLRANTSFGLNVTPIAAQTGGADLTNSVTSGGSNDTIADFNATVNAGSDTLDKADLEGILATIRNDIYQLARTLKQDHDALRDFGMLT